MGTESTVYEAIATDLETLRRMTQAITDGDIVWGPPKDMTPQPVDVEIDVCP